MTHRHPLAGDVSAAVACLCRALIHGLDWPTARATAQSGRMKETNRALEGPKIESLNREGFAPDTLAAAIYFVTTSSCFGEALRAAVHFAGPANYCPVLVGAIGGARWGMSEIPQDTTRHLGNLLTVVRILGQELANSWDG